MSTPEKRILIVDDDEAIRALLFTVLRRRGFKADGARNGVEALARMRSCHYAVMLLDLMMPMKSGWEVMDELKSMQADIRPVVIVLTAGNEPRDLDPTLVAASIRKPFDVTMIVNTVVECTNTATPRPQVPECPPAETTVTPRDRVN